MPRQNIKTRIIIRPTKIEDAKAIWRIRNNPIVRKNSNNRASINFKKHIDWFKNKYFINNKNYCFVLERSHEVAGYCRFDLSNNKYLVSIALSPAFHGLGLGERLLFESLQSINNKKIVAQINFNNSASIKLFLKNNFEIYHQDKDSFYLKYKKRKNLENNIVNLYYKILAQALKKSDAIVWLQGNRYDRAEKVLELYKKGWSKTIIVTGNDILVGSRERKGEENVFIKDMINWLLAHRVRREDLIIDRNSLNTNDQAKYIMNLAKKKKWEKIILVGSSYYQPRAFLTFLKQSEIKKWQGTIINQPALIPWQKKPDGRNKYAWQCFHEETEKIKRYKKDMANIKEGIGYLL